MQQLSITRAGFLLAAVMGGWAPASQIGGSPAATAAGDLANQPQLPQSAGNTVHDVGARPAEPRLVRSAHFVFCTDLTEREWVDLRNRLERMTANLERFLGRRLAGMVEGFVVKDLATFPVERIDDPMGIEKIRRGEGVCVSSTLGRQRRAVLYACGDTGVVQHECVHGLCHLAFGSTGPTWLAEGLAELGSYWRENDPSVALPQPVVAYLQTARPTRHLAEIATPGRAAAGGWQDYAWRWALCHLLANNPNYADRFIPLAIGLMENREGVSFESVYGPVAAELSFEYDQFLATLGNGSRPDLTAWPWQARFARLADKGQRRLRIKARSGWQASGVLVEKDLAYSYDADGQWQTTAEGLPVGGGGGPGGRGRLVAAVFNEFTLSPEIPLGPTGAFQAPASGQLMLRCHDAWTELADNSGGLTIVLRRGEAVAAMDPATPAEPGVTGVIDRLADYLHEHGCDGVATADFAPLPLSRADAETAAEMLASARLAEDQYRLGAGLGREVTTGLLTVGDERMPYWYSVHGEKPARGHSLFISLHGGGQAAAEVNTNQWHNQKRLYQPEEGIYVVPRAPGNTWDLWHRPHIDQFLDRLIRLLVTLEGVDPDRVYLLGYSAGGDGVYQLAPRMADRFAAAAMMAGHPNETKPDGLRNLPFAIWVGARDNGYERNTVAATWGAALEGLAAADPGGYPHELHLVPNKGHWMDQEDAAALPWMAKHTRNSRPDRVVWLQDEVTHERMYWLAVSKPRARSRLVVHRSGQRITIEEWPDQGRLAIRLDDSMLDLERPVTVVHRDQEIFHGVPPRTIQNLAITLAERGDPRGLFSAEIKVSPPQP